MKRPLDFRTLEIGSVSPSLLAFELFREISSTFSREKPALNRCTNS